MAMEFKAHATEAGNPAATARDVAGAIRAIAAQGWMQNAAAAKNAAPVSANELTSLTALIAYVAHKSGASEFRVARRLADRFNIANVSCLPGARFDDAIRYLVDEA